MPGRLPYRKQLVDVTKRLRIGITVVTALLLGAFRYGHAFDIDPPGVLGDIWYGSALGPLLYGAAIFGVFLVNRWWALLPAIVPVAVNIYLYNLTDYVSPWHEEPIPTLSDEPASIVLVLLAVAIQAAILALGLLLRWAWERLRIGSASISKASAGCE